MSPKELPASLLRDMETIPGFNLEPFLEAHQQPAVTSVRLHPIKGSSVSFVATPVPWCPEGLYLNERPVFTLDPAYHAGAYYVQEASSMFLAHLIRELLPERNCLRVLDLCGAPGGKTTLIASLLGEDSLLVSNEVIRTRASILEENTVRWGYTNNWVTSNDPKDFGKLEGYFDMIVVDAPCSGSGLFRKDARALEEWSEANVALCSQRQQRILADVWPSLKEDGILIYATCSYSPQEDEMILDWLASELETAPLAVNYPQEWGIVPALSPQHNYPGYRFFPGNVGGEGFFIAAVRKKDSPRQAFLPRFRSAHDKKAWEQARYLLRRDDVVCIRGRDHYHVINANHEADLELLSKYVYMRKTGLALGLPAAKEWLPAHDVALSVDKSDEVPFVDLSREEALRFLKKEEITVLPAKGWHLVTYRGMGLGWIKSLGNRVNNYLPKNWRIRMELPPEDWA